MNKQLVTPANENDLRKEHRDIDRALSDYKHHRDHYIILLQQLADTVNRELSEQTSETPRWSNVGPNNRLGLLQGNGPALDVAGAGYEMAQGAVNRIAHAAGLVIESTTAEHDRPDDMTIWTAIDSHHQKLAWRAEDDMTIWTAEVQITPEA